MEIEKGKEGIYIYCLINDGIDISFGNIGIENEEVYTIPFKDLGAVVHKHGYGHSYLCESESENKEDILELFISHQHIIDMATEKFGTVIPFNLNSTIEGKEEKVLEWLKRDYSKIKNMLKGVDGKAEFEIQIFVDPDVLIDRIKDESEEFKRLKELKMNPGKRYVLGQRILREELRGEMDSFCKSFYTQISKSADEIQINKTEEALMQEQQLIINLSCLICKNKVEELKTVLKKIYDLEGFNVCLSGPWQPYNFIDTRKLDCEISDVQCNHAVTRWGV